MASGMSPASLERCFALVEAVEAYPIWHRDVVREVVVVERGAVGEAKKVGATLRVARGTLARDMELTLEVWRDPLHEVRLTRVPNEATDEEQFQVVWRLNEVEGGSRMQLELRARLSVPRLVPLGGIGDSMASGFVMAAVRSLEAAES